MKVLIDPAFPLSLSEGEDPSSRADSHLQSMNLQEVPPTQPDHCLRRLDTTSLILNRNKSLSLALSILYPIQFK